MTDPAPNLFAPNPLAAAPVSTPSGDTSSAQPNFADSTPWDSDDGEGFDMPAAPIGVLTTEVLALRVHNGNYWLDVRCTDPAYANAEKVGVFVGKDMQQLRAYAKALGLTEKIKRVGNKQRAFYTDEQGNKDAAAFKGKSFFAFWDPYNGNPGLSRFGLAGPDKRSEEMKMHIEEAGYSSEQLAALTKARGGVVPSNLVHLFSGHG